MNYRISDIKLKHLEKLIQEDVDMKDVMVEVFGYKNTWWDRKIAFQHKAKQAFEIVNQFRTINISQLSLEEDCGIKYPSKVDRLSFQCRLEIGNIASQNLSPTDQIISTIALTCFTTQHKVKFNSDSKLFKSFRDHISNQPALNMLGLYNDLRKKLDESNEEWNRAFKLVEIIDLDYQEAGGEAMLKPFSLLNTIKKMQRDHRVSYEEAFLLPYSLVQSGNLEVARSNWVQDRMREIKERNMKLKDARQR